MRIEAPFVIALLTAMPAAADDLDVRAVAMFEAAYGPDQCLHYRNDRQAPTRREFVVEDTSRDITVTTYEFACDLGAYNLRQAFLIHTEADGLRPVAFASPVPDVHYRQTAENKDDPYVGPVERIDIVGYKTSMTSINPEVDETTGQIVTREVWRGIGDASSSGIWDLTAGGYVLRRYEIDATYNGEVDPVTVLNLLKDAD
ncbi:hypothetical protein [Paracoccus sp. ME4]|uniref:hypothetical protein n=1 Tax=Paracoccus sp. ME4 TaxID=3138066 RepID=UPI00398AC2E6